MPLTFICMSTAAAALIGLPLTSGYLSKDAILISSFEWAADQSGIISLVPYLMTLTSWLTAFYISRLIFNVFLASPKDQTRLSIQHTQEAPRAMAYVLVALGFLCSFMIFSFNPFSFDTSWLWKGFQSAGIQRNNLLHWLIPLVVNLGSLMLIYFAYQVYVKRDTPLFSENSFWYRFSKQEWYFNEIYSMMFSKPVEKLASVSYKFDQYIIDGFVSKLVALITLFSSLSDWFDRNVVDGLVNGIAALSRYIGRIFRNFQSGKLQHYFITMLFVVLSFFIITYLL